MKQTLAAAVVACAGLVGSAGAVVNTRMDILLTGGDQVFGQQTNVTHLDLVPGNGVRRVEVVYRMTYIGAAPAVGLASAIFQPTIGGPSGSPALTFVPLTAPFGSNTTIPSGAVPNAPGQYGRISPWARTTLNSSQAMTGHTHIGGTAGAPAGTWMRIAQQQVTSWIGGAGNTTGAFGIPIGQLSNVGRTTADPAFSTSLSVDVFRFAIDVDTSLFNGNFSTLYNLDVPFTGFGNRVNVFNPSFPNSGIGDREVYWWGGMDETAGTLRGTCMVNASELHVWIGPSPSSAAVLAVAGGVLGRRRRP